MLDYASQRAVEILSIPHKTVLATSGPAGLQACECSCQAIDLILYLWVPKTSDHLFNLEVDSTVILLTASWELKGKAMIVPPEEADPRLDLLSNLDSEWYVLVRVDPHRLHIHREVGWGNIETIDLKP